MVLRRCVIVLRTVVIAAIATMMLAPTGICLCSDHDDDTAPEQHEPGCPKVRKLDRAEPPVDYTPDVLSLLALTVHDDEPAAGPARPVVAVGHGPPNGRQIYLALHILLI
jgi:hypothetical protein